MLPYCEALERARPEDEEIFLIIYSGVFRVELGFCFEFS